MLSIIDLVPRPFMRYAIEYPAHLMIGSRNSLHWREVLFLCLLAGLFPLIPQAGDNLWPVGVTSTTREGFERRQYIPPLIEHTRTGNTTWEAYRPLFLWETIENDPTISHRFSLLYPFFQHKRSETASEWNIFHLVRARKVYKTLSDDFETNLIRHYQRSFEIFPFWFDHRSQDEESSYFGVLPIYGELKNRLFFDRISWVLFPLYVRFDDNGETTRTYLWPVFRHREGNNASGWAVWPLYGQFEREGHYAERFALWPLIYDQQAYDGDALRFHRKGYLPFYSMEARPGYLSENYLWPFFGHTTIDQPAYREIRAFWPIFMWGDGENRHVRQFAPFYSHSLRNGRESTWLLWPLVNIRETSSSGLDIWRLKIAYILYWDMRQFEAADPSVKVAQKSHLWPLYSYWELGEQERQFQLLSPLEPLFPTNDTIRKQYSPLFSLFRYSRSGNHSKEIELLFSLLRYHRNDQERRFSLGPIFRIDRSTDSSGWSLLRGLISFNKTSGGKRRWGFLWTGKCPEPESTDDQPPPPGS